MPGAGQYPAGTGRAGFAPQVATIRTAPTQPRALFFDPTTRTFPLDVNGEVLSTHPVDQAVCIALGVGLGTLRSTVPSGIDLTRLRRVSRAAMQSTVNDVVRTALDKLIRDGDVALISSPVLQNIPGRVVFQVNYTNLRSGEGRTVSVP